MKIKDIKEFRKWFKNNKKARQNNELYNEDFMGVSHGDNIGFFGMYHGEKDDIYGFLRKEVEMAEDGQAIYEFVQNAADSNSTHFYMFFNKDYFIAINNGDQFTKDGIKSILNIGQSYGKTDSNKIGRYGIGFKLVHRLVGKGSGLDELMNKDNEGYRGPILFSWSDKNNIKEFLEVENFSKTSIDEDSPWLLKILLTNFPSHPNEEVKDIDFKDSTPFKNSELKEFQKYLNSLSSHIDFEVLDKGSMFFIKLGDGKYEYLTKQEDEYTQGLATSMHFLKSLNVININGNEVKHNNNTKSKLIFITPKGTNEFLKIGLTEERDKNSDIQFTVIYDRSIDGSLEIQKHPNIYKYFPAVKEVNNLSFLLHSNVFELTSNRQNLQETEKNKELLKLLSSHIINKLEEYKTSDKKKFRDIFKSIVLSKKPENYTGNGWQKEYFLDKLMDYARLNIPTKNNTFIDYKDVLIKNTKLDIHPSDFGISKEWLYWDNEISDQLIKEIHEKLNIEKYNLKELIGEGHIEAINFWINELPDEKYYLFLKELLSIEKIKNIREIKFIRCGDNKLYSLNEVYYHKELLKSNNYHSLSNAVEILTGYKVPKIEMLKLLKDSKFDIEDKNLFDYIEEAELDIEDTKAIIEFTKKVGKGCFFKNGYFEQKKSVLSYQKSYSIKQYYSNKEKLNSFVKENLSSVFHLLPISLEDFNKEENILKNEELYHCIIDEFKGDENIRYLVDFLPKEYLLKAIKKIDKINFKSQDKYSEDDFEYKLLNNCNDEIIKELKKKIYIDEEFYLKKAMSSSKIKFEIDNQTYDLEISEILPKSDFYDNAKKVSKISQALKKANISKEILDNLFDSTEIVEDDYHQIKDELLEKEDCVLKNATQLAYILFYNKKIDRLDLSSIYVTNMNNNDLCLKDKTFYINELSFIDNENVLNKEKYIGLSKLLKLKKERFYFEVSYTSSILLEPYFDKEAEKFVCRYIKEDMNNEEKVALLEFIYNYWESSNPNKRLIENVNWSSIGEYKTIDIFEFEPKKTILDGTDISKNDEKVPEWLEKWMVASKNKNKFLENLGLITSCQEEYKIREAILKNKSYKLKDIDDEFLNHTLEWIVEKEIKVEKNAYEIIEEIADRIGIELEKSIDNVNLEENSKSFNETFDNTYYDKWTEEFEFEIYFYDGEIPYNVFYNGYKLQEYQEGDQKITGKQVYLNENKFKEEVDLKNINLDNKEAEKRLMEYVLKGSNEELRKIKNENDKLIKKLKKYENLNNISEDLGDSNTDEKMIKEVNKEAQKIVKKALPEEGYDCSVWENNYSIIQGVKYQGKDVTLVIKSAKAGTLYLNPMEWNYLEKQNTHLIILIEGNELIVIDKNIKEDIKKVNDTFAVKFDTDSFGIKNIDELSKMLSDNYTKGVHFIFQTPKFSYSKSLKNIEYKNEGELTPALEEEF